MKNVKFETVQNSINAAFDTRIASASNDNMKAFLTKMHKSFCAINAAQSKALYALDIDLIALSNRIAVSDASSSEFIAQYALEKVIKTCKALASGSASALDKYTFSIVKNLNELQKLDNLNTQRTLCSKIELSEFAQEQAVKVYHNCSPSTASTQASSTRMMLQALNICNVTKRAKNDAISFAETESAKALQEMLAIA